MFTKGGPNLVRRLDFQDGTRWVARLQLGESPEISERLTSEVHTMAVVRERSEIPVPEVYAFEADRGGSNPVGVPFIIMEFVPGDTVMDSFGGYRVHYGRVPAHIKPGLHAAMADAQVQMSAIRFPRVGSIIKAPDGIYTTGPLPGHGGPFASAREYFEAWADNATFLYSEELIRERTPAHIVEDVLLSIKEFPQRLKEFAKTFTFREGPYPLFHTDFKISNIIMDAPHEKLLVVIDWEMAFVAPWEVVEFATSLSIVPPPMDGPAYYEDERDHELAVGREEYVRTARAVEEEKGLDDCLSATLGSRRVQYLAHAFWLYKIGRIGFYGKVLDGFKEGEA